MSSIDILVIDDEPHVSLLVEHACQELGYQITAARSLEEARRQLREGPSYDLLLLDVKLPDGSGLDLLAELRAEPATRQLPVIVLTGAGFDALLDRATQLGGTVVTKPFSPSKLGRLLNEILGAAN